MSSSIFDNIIAFQDTTIDYDEHIALIIYVASCNLSCKYCYNWRAIHDKSVTDFEYIAGIIKNNSEYYDGVVICGGEPSLYEDLPNMIEYLHNLNVDVKVDTNGNNLERIKTADYVAVDYKYPLNMYKKMVGSVPSDLIKALKYVGERGEIRTTVTPDHVDLDNIMYNELREIRNTRPVKWTINEYQHISTVRDKGHYDKFKNVNELTKLAKSQFDIYSEKINQNSKEL